MNSLHELQQVLSIDQASQDTDILVLCTEGICCLNTLLNFILSLSVYCMSISLCNRGPYHNHQMLCIVCSIKRTHLESEIEPSMTTQVSQSISRANSAIALILRGIALASVVQLLVPSG